MRSMISAAAILLACLVPTLRAQTITITGPDTAEPGQYVQLTIAGIDPANLAAAGVACVPKPTLLLPAITWGGQPFLLFSAAAEGTYAVTVSQNPWRRELDAAVAKAARAGIDPLLLAKLKAAAGEIAKRYPTAAGKKVITVGNPNPDPNPDPGPDPQPGPRWLIIIEESARRTAAQSTLYLTARRHLADDLAGDRLLIADKDVTDAAGQSPPALVPYLTAAAGKTLPYLFVVTAAGKVRYSGPLPTNYQEFLTLARK